MPPTPSEQSACLDYCQKKVYVAGSTRDVERVKAVQEIAQAFGCEITFDWTGAEGEIRTDGSWDTAPDQGARIAKREVRACADAGLIILLFPPTGGGLGCWIEMGAGLATGAEVWVVAPQRDSVFWQHPQVTRLDDVGDVAVRLHEAFNRAGNPYPRASITYLTCDDQPETACRRNAPGAHRAPAESPGAPLR